MRMFVCNFVFAAGLSAAAVAAPEKLSKVPVAVANPAISCDAAKAYVLNTPDDKLTISKYNENMAVYQKCKAEALSKNAARDKSTKRVIATGHYDADKRIMVFGLISVDPKDAAGIKQICSAIASTVGLQTPSPDIVSAAGSVGCNSYVDAALRSDPILIVAPTLIPGIDISKDVLRAAGVPNDVIDGAEKAIRDGAGTAASTAVQTGVGVATGGIVQVDPEVRCVSAFGHRVCR